MHLTFTILKYVFQQFLVYSLCFVTITTIYYNSRTLKRSSLFTSPVFCLYGFIYSGCFYINRIMQVTFVSDFVHLA